MEINNCEQGTEEWYQARLGIATASEFSKVITSEGKTSTSLNDYAFTLASELLTEVQEEGYINTTMLRGTELEEEARQAYIEHTLETIEQVGFIKQGSYGYSPDGLVGSEGLIEIKCPTQKVHTKYLYNKSLPSQYKAQVQGGLLVTGRKWCDFISYNPNFIEKRRLLIVRVTRDEAFIKALEDRLRVVNDRKETFLKEINNE